MLPHINRLTKKKEFDNVFKNGFGTYNKAIGIKAINNNLGINRYGIIVSTKISKSAVIRNKIKRQIREIIKDEILKYNISKDYIIITLPPVKELNLIEVKKIIQQIFKKLANIK
jgi:ribonuclease P protein component